MGDRANIVVRQENNTNKGDVWFYTHWRGHDIADVVKSALAKKERWEDSSYLARIIFDELRGDDNGTTGFGISTTLQDNEHEIIVVDVPNQVVFKIKESSLIDYRLPDIHNPPDRISFEDYINPKPEDGK